MTKHQNTELLPCPFCGAGENRVDESNHWTGQRNQLISVEIIHWCNRGTIDGAILKVRGRTHEEAINRWNARALTPEGEGIAGKGEQAIEDLDYYIEQSGTLAHNKIWKDKFKNIRDCLFRQQKIDVQKLKREVWEACFKTGTGTVSYEDAIDHLAEAGYLSSPDGKAQKGKECK